MMREPWFWRSRSPTARMTAAVLSPLSFAYDVAQRARWKLSRPVSPAIPVICIGNATLGGVGKTPFAIALHQLLKARNVACHFLTRGYGGALPGPLLVDRSKHSAADIGDEALLLARHGPTWVARNRPTGAQRAAEMSAEAVIMDDGFQNPTIAKTVSILLSSAEDTLEREKVFPAGPLREPFKRARKRADFTVCVGADQIRARQGAVKNGLTFAAWLEPVDPPPPQRVVAFSGIAKPHKFFTALETSGFELVHAAAFPDHHPFKQSNLDALVQLAAQKKAKLITTEKDHVRLPGTFRDKALTFPVRMDIDQPAQLADAVISAIGRRAKAD